MASCAASARRRGTARGSTAEDTTRVSGMTWRCAMCRHALLRVGTVVRVDTVSGDSSCDWGSQCLGASEILCLFFFTARPHCNAVADHCNSQSDSVCPSVRHIPVFCPDV